MTSKSLRKLLQRGIINPGRIPTFLFRQLPGGVSVDRWGRHAPGVKLAEWKYKRGEYPHETTPIWEEDWDLLVVLDACRPEWMEALRDEYDCVTEVETTHSVGSHSNEWLTNTFCEEYAAEMAGTIYITGNHYAEQIDVSQFRHFETAQHSGDWAYNSPSPPASVITDLAVDAARETDWDRCVIHYMQPHKPFLKRVGRRGEVAVKEGSQRYDPYLRYLNNEISMEDLEKEFIDNLRYVLEEVELLLKNIDADSVSITSDHGQALGEDGLWDHVDGVKHPSMRRVPWVETTASDEQTLDPDQHDKADYDDELVKENLELLGYR